MRLLRNSHLNDEKLFGPALGESSPSIMRRPAFWIPVALVCFAITVLAVWAALLLPRVMVAKQALEDSLPLAIQAKQEMFAGETAQAQKTVAQLSLLVNRATESVDFPLWKAGEYLPIVGENLRAVRIVAETVSSLNTDVLAPATEVRLSGLQTDDGGIDLETISALIHLAQNATQSVSISKSNLDDLNKDELIEPVKIGVQQLQKSISQILTVIEPANKVLPILPKMLGFEGERNYLVMFQNNAEIRSGGGNPASLAVISANNGRIKITQQASSSDFRELNIQINPETEAIYGNGPRRWIQDTTYTPFFSETAELIRNHWEDAFGTKVDGVISFDPVGLSYLLRATGPVFLPTGEELTSENAVPILTNEVYFHYPVAEQDPFFEGAARTIFSALTSKQVDQVKMLEALSRSVDEGRLLYSSYEINEMKLLENSRITGPLPQSNVPFTVLGVFSNYFLSGKMDYYMDSTVEGASNICVGSPPDSLQFSAEVKLHNKITEAEYKKLPAYITDRNEGSGIYRDLMFYGPIGTKVKSVKINGIVRQPSLVRWGNGYRVLSHNNRPVVQVPMYVPAEETASINVTFVANSGQSAASFGVFEIRATPTVRNTPVSTSQKVCK